MLESLQSFRWIRDVRYTGGKEQPRATKKKNNTKQQQNTNTAACGNPPVPPFHTVISTTKTLAPASETPPGSRSHTRGASLGKRNEALETFLFFFLLPL